MVVGGISALLLALAYWFVARQGLAGQLTAGDLFLVLGAFAAVGGAVSALSGSVVALQAHAPYLRDYDDFLDLPNRLPIATDPTPLPPAGTPTDEAGQTIRPGLALKHVTFSYPTATQPALRDIDLEIAPGEMVALVGDNEAAKTTLVKLLLHHYDPQEGQVLLGGVDVRDVAPHELRERFGVLFQDFAQYNLTVRENLQLGRVERQATDDELWTALHSAKADFVQDLPLRLDATVGKLYEWGRDISGGQWQRLALARLMYRKAGVWILDEPTSALDPEADGRPVEVRWAASASSRPMPVRTRADQRAASPGTCPRQRSRVRKGSPIGQVDRGNGLHGLIGWGVADGHRRPVACVGRCGSLGRCCRSAWVDRSLPWVSDRRRRRSCRRICGNAIPRRISAAPTMNGRNVPWVGGHVAAMATVEPATTTNPVMIATRGPHSHRTAATTRWRILMPHLPVRARLNKAVGSRMQLSASKSGSVLYRR